MPVYSPTGGSIIPQGGAPGTPLPPSVPTPAPKNTAYIQAGIDKANNQGKPGYDVFGDPLKKPSEPAVITSTTISDKVIPDAQKKVADLAKKGSFLGPDNQPYYADGSAVGGPEGSTFDPATGKYKPTDTTSYDAASFYGNEATGDKGDAAWQAVQAQFAPLKSQLDADTLALVNSIHDQFNALRAQQQQFNKGAEAVRSRGLFTSGTTRYAPADAQGVMLAQTSYGLQQIANLDAQENTAIANAQAAARSDNMELMTKALGMAEDARKEKQTAATKILDQINTANQKLAEQKKQSSRDEAIAGIASQGITDPKQILNYLNEYDDGTPTGGDFTADEVDKALKALTIAGTTAKDLTNDFQTFQYIRDNPDIGLPKDIAALPPGEQYFAYLAKVKGAQTAPKTSKTATTGTGAPTWEEYKTVAAKVAGVNYLPGPEEAQLKAQYDAQYGDNPNRKAFTDTELKKLEQAGLLNADRQKQLDYLFKKTDTAESVNLPSSLK